MWTYLGSYKFGMIRRFCVAPTNSNHRHSTVTNWFPIPHVFVISKHCNGVTKLKMLKSTFQFCSGGKISISLTFPQTAVFLLLVPVMLQHRAKQKSPVQMTLQKWPLGGGELPRSTARDERWPPAGLVVLVLRCEGWGNCPSCSSPCLNRPVLPHQIKFHHCKPCQSTRRESFIHTQFTNHIYVPCSRSYLQCGIQNRCCQGNHHHDHASKAISVEPSAFLLEAYGQWARHASPLAYPVDSPQQCLPLQETIR